MQRPESAQKLGIMDLMLFAMIVIWAVNFSVIKYGSQTFSTQAFAVIRINVAGIILLALAFSSKTPWPSRRDIIALGLLGVLGHAIYQMFFIHGVARTRVGDSALIISATPALIAIASRFRGTDRVTRRVMAGIALSLLGVAVVVLGSSKSTHGQSTPLGITLIVMGTICWSVFTIYLEPLTRRIDGIKISAITLAGGMIPLLVIAPKALAGVNWSGVSTGAWGALFYSSVVSMVIAYMVWYRGIKVLGPTRTSTYANLQPILATLVAWMMLGEVPTPWQLVGIVTVVTGVFLART